MGREIKIAPSILAADFANLERDIMIAQDAGADMIHLDIMDGHFVDNITFGLPVIECIRKITKLPLDAHLMIANPLKYVDEFLNAGVDILTFHLESCAFDYAQKRVKQGYTIALLSKPLIDVEKVKIIVDKVKGRRKVVGMAINPDTPADLLEEVIDVFDLVLIMTVWPGFGGQRFIIDTIPKITKIRSMRREIDIEVDGGVNQETVEVAAKEGANIFVAGTATFKAKDVKDTIVKMRRIAINNYPES